MQKNWTPAEKKKQSCRRNCFPPGFGRTLGKRTQMFPLFCSRIKPQDEGLLEQLTHSKIPPFRAWKMNGSWEKFHIAFWQKEQIKDPFDTAFSADFLLL